MEQAILSSFNTQGHEVFALREHFKVTGADADYDAWSIAAVEHVCSDCGKPIRKAQGLAAIPDPSFCNC